MKKLDPVSTAFASVKNAKTILLTTYKRDGTATNSGPIRVRLPSRADVAGHLASALTSKDYKTITIDRPDEHPGLPSGCSPEPR